MDFAILNRFPDWNKISSDLETHYNLYRNNIVIIHDITRHASVPMHDTTLTVKYAFKGNEYYLTDNCKFRVNNNNFLIINARKKYESYIDSDHEVESIAVFFNPKFVSDAYLSLMNNKSGLQEEIPAGNGQFTLFERLYAADEKIVPILNILRTSIRSNSADKNQITELLLMLINDLLYLQNDQLKEIENLVYKKRSTREELYKRLNNAKDYILSCYEENISLDELSVVTSLEKHYLLREFKKYFGMTPYKYITCVRMKEAGKMLIETLKPVSEISALAGFEYLSSFSSLFTKHFKVSPMKYREHNSTKSQF